MIGMTMSFIALLHADPTLFDPLTLPDGMDKDTLIQLIITEGAELETAYPHPEVFKTVLSAWSKANQIPWERMWNAENVDYNPLHNYDRVEEFTDTSTGTNTATSTATNTDKRAGFDAPSVFENHSQQTGDGSSSNTINASNTRSGTVKGNIGVTTSQQMLESEINLRRNFTTYAVITGQFLERFCLGVY